MKEMNIVRRISISIKHMNARLYVSLLVLGLCPTIYTTVRVFFVGQLPGEYSYSIAGQLSWVNLLYEILSEAIILPLFFFIGKVYLDKKEFANRMRTGLLVSFVVYIVFSASIVICAEELLRLMAVDVSIIEESAQYIRIESMANIFLMMFNYISVGLVTLGKSRYVYTITGVKLVMCVVLDVFMVSTLPVSLNLGVNGIAFTNIIVNLTLLVISILILRREGINLLTKDKLEFSWMKGFLKIGGISGLESFVRNVAYMLMISRMVNIVGEQGTYWVANNFIWGWLLLPVLQLGELIKREVATDESAVRTNTIGYLAVTIFICIGWCATIPLWKIFMKNILGYSDVDKLYELVILLLGFYVLYAVQNVFDATFYGLGKTKYMLFESVVTNTFYYGGAYIFYVTGIWTPSLVGIALLFGIGNAIDSIVSFVAYAYLLKKNSINILQVL